MTDTAPVDVTTDYDLFDPDFVRDPYPAYDEIRETCPVAHTDRYQGSWMPTSYEDLRDFAAETDLFSSEDVLVTPRPETPDRRQDRVCRRQGTADQLGSARAQLDPSTDPADLRPWCGEAVRAGHQGSVQLADRLVHRHRTGRRGDRLRPADPGSGHRHHARRRHRTGRRIRRAGCVASSSSV